MRLRSTALALLLAALPLWPAAAPAAPAAYRVVNLPALGCSLELPASWVGHKKGKALVFAGAQGSDEFRTTISLQVVHQRAYPSLQAVAADYLKQWSTGQGFKLLTRQDGEVSGHPGLLLAARYLYQGQAFHQEQVIVSRPPYYYLLGYTSPERLRKMGQPHFLHAVRSFRFLPLPAPKAAPGAVPDAAARLRLEQASVAAYGPALLKQLEGPLYSHAFNHGTPQGQEVAAAHNQIVAELARTLAAQASAQKPALAWLAKLGDLQLRQMALLERAKAQAPAAAAHWARAKALLKLSMDYRVVRAAQRGAVEGALIGQAKPSEASLSLAGVQMLAKLQLAVSDQLALLLQENDRLWAPSLRLWEAVSADPALPAAFRLSLAQLNREQRELALGLTRATISANGAMAATVLVIGNLAAFYDEVSRTYGAAINAALPRLRQDARRLAAARPGDPSVEAVNLILDNLAKTAAQVKLAAGPGPCPPLGQRLADALVPPAQAGAWQFTKDFVSNVGYSVLIAGKAAQNAGRFIASGVETSSQRAAQMLAYGTYSPLKVTSNPQAILATADEIIAQNPEMAKHRAVLQKRLGQIASRHQTENLNDYLQLKKQTVDAAVAEYATGQYGVRALQTGVQYIDEVSRMKVKPAAAWVADKVSKEVLGHQVGGAVSPFSKGVASWMAGTAYNVVADLPKNTMILMNPATSYADKGAATVSLAGNVGVSVLCYSGTAAAMAGKVAPKLAAASQSLMSWGSQVVGRMLPAGAKAAAQATAQMVRPVAAQVTKQVAREAAALLPLEAQAASYIAGGIRAGVQGLKEMAAKPVLATMGAETKALVSTIQGEMAELVAKKSGAELIKAFAGKFTLTSLMDGTVNDTFSAAVLQPTLQAVEKQASPPAPQPAASPPPQPAAKPEPKAEAGGFRVKAAAPPQAQAKEAKPAPQKNKTARRAEGQAEREARQKELLAKAKRAAARDETVYGKQETDATQVIPETCTIDLVVWHPNSKEYRVPEVLYVRGGQVTGTTQHSFSYAKYANKDWGCNPMRYSGAFEGSLSNGQISGTWRLKHQDHHCWMNMKKSKKGADGKTTYYDTRCEYTQWGTNNVRMDYTFLPGGRLEAVWSGHGSNTTSWGPGCYEKWANTTKTDSFSYGMNDPKNPPEYRTPMVGLWQIRKRPPAEEKQDK